MQFLKKLHQHIAAEGLGPALRNVLRHIWYNHVHCLVAVYAAVPSAQMGRQLPEGFEVVCRTTAASLTPQEYRQFEELKGVAVARNQISDRYRRGSTLWMLQHESVVLGFLWAIRGASPDGFLPLLPNDMYLYDGGAFPHERGKGMFAKFLTAVTTRMFQNGIQRVYFGVATWNSPMIKCATKTQFVLVGHCYARSIGAKDIAVWTDLKREGINAEEGRCV